MNPTNHSIPPLFRTFAAGLALSLTATPWAGADAWVDAAPMRFARVHHTATLLPNGKVLVAGGWEPGGRNCELYDPASDTWTRTGSLNVAHGQNHIAVLLCDGNVLVSGGGTKSAELYDPATGSWTLARPMHDAEYLRSAILLPSGKVLVKGAQSRPELFDPDTGTWRTEIAPLTGGDSHALLPNGKVFNPFSGKMYDPATWQETATSTPSPYYCRYPTLLLTGEVLYRVGREWDSAVLYDFRSGTWTPTNPMNEWRTVNTMTVLPNGNALFTGGEIKLPTGGRLWASSSAELYDPATRTWSSTAPMRYTRAAHTATLLPNGKVLVTGGADGSIGPVSSAELYVPDSDGVAPSLNFLNRSDGILSFSWHGRGTLEQSDDLSNWQPSPIQDNPQIRRTTESKKFFRVKAD